ncbi:MAG TPA: histidine kinase dimerization/phosphoacceptor domain -containing protein [Spirochaetia bacterium]|nr:histidine kinase dimerization/phosphoacceptor domain -containing protein [Spirochaetales bacterium]HRY80302.1 histidine kinase dimerization/phosphoacceptor domain -containing protein [Spirochaetia bacterium]HRZ87942.1 histidine kinase dimerization/phosphoacceptor domain -containing protein [Spirochaetia bacterium]
MKNQARPVRAAGLLLAVLLAAAPVTASDGFERERFLILNSYHHGFEWSDGILRGILEVLSREFARPALHIEYMDTKRHFDGIDGPYLDGLAAVYAAKYTRTKFDAVLCTDDAAFLFLLRWGRTLFPGTPVVFTGVNNFSPDLVAGRPEITGIVERTEYGPSVELGLRLRPEARRLGVITDASLNGLANRAKFEALAESFRGRLEFVFFRTDGLSELLEEVRAFDPGGLIYFSDFYLDGRGRSYEYDVSVPEVLAAAPCPVLYHADMYLPFGVLGGRMNRSREYGELAARMAARIVRGEPPSAIPVMQDSIARAVVSYPALRKFGIPESRVPPGTLVADKPESFLRRNARLLTVSGIITLSLSGVIVSLLYAIRERRRAERDLHASRETILQSLREKEVLLQEVHHRVKNNLQIVTSLLRLQSAHSGKPEVEEALTESTERLMAMALVHEQLYLSKNFADIEYSEYAAGLVSSLRATFGLSEEAFRCSIDSSGLRLGLDTAVPLGLILNELLTNSVKYALPARSPLSVRSLLEEADGMLRFRYQDDGPGLPVGLDPEKDGGLGLTLITALSQQLRGAPAFPRDRAGMVFELDFTPRFPPRGKI